jgi:hypothetical protein
MGVCIDLSWFCLFAKFVFIGGVSTSIDNDFLYVGPLFVTQRWHWYFYQGSKKPEEFRLRVDLTCLMAVGGLDVLALTNSAKTRVFINIPCKS